MPALPTIKAAQLIRALMKIGFQITRQRGSHVRLKHADGRVVSVPVHAAQDMGRGLLRKILRDAKLSTQDLVDLLEEK